MCRPTDSRSPGATRNPFSPWRTNSADPARAGPDDRQAEAHGFERRDAEALVGKGHGEHVAAGVNRFQARRRPGRPRNTTCFPKPWWAMIARARRTQRRSAAMSPTEGEPPSVSRQARQVGEERRQPLDGRQVPDEQQLEGAALAAFFGDETLGG